MRSFTLALGVVAFVVAGCSGDDGNSNDQSPEDRLAAAKEGFDDAEFVGFTLATADLPEDLDGLLSASGTGTHDPAFTGEVEVQTDINITAPLIALDGKVYAELPFAGWSELDPDDYGAPDPAGLMDPDGGISSLFTATEEPEEGEQSRSGENVLTEINGTLAGDAVRDVFPSSGSEDFEVTYSLTDDNDVHKVTMTGPFYEGSEDVTYTIDLDLDAESVQIEAPI